MKWRNLLFVAALASISSHAFAVGAIAVDDEMGEDEPGYGFSYGYDNKEAAMKRALQECRKHGNTNCKVKVWFNGCGAYAASQRYYGVGWGSNKRTAESNALKQCGNRNCEIKISECDQ